MIPRLVQGGACLSSDPPRQGGCSKGVAVCASEGGGHCFWVKDVSHCFSHRYLGSLTTTLNHKTCLDNTSRQVLEKTLFAINAIFTQDNNLSKTKVEGFLQKTNATCSKCKTNLILTYLHQSRRHLSSQSQKRESTILSDKNKLLPNISSVNENFGPTQCCPMVPC